MADGRRVGLFAAISAALIVVLGAVCCAFFPALFAGIVGGFVSGRWWIAVVVFVLVIGGISVWSRRQR